MVDEVAVLVFGFSLLAIEERDARNEDMYLKLANVSSPSTLLC